MAIFQVASLLCALMYPVHYMIQIWAKYVQHLSGSFVTIQALVSMRAVVLSELKEGGLQFRIIYLSSVKVQVWVKMIRFLLDASHKNSLCDTLCWLQWRTEEARRRKWRRRIVLKRRLWKRTLHIAAWNSKRISRRASLEKAYTNLVSLISHL